MSYSKITWVNNQTKLNANNMNHLEAGIDELATKIETVENSITAAEKTIEGKQPLLVSGTNIKTINGESLLGSEDIVIKAAAETKYEELDGISLDDAKTQGVYKVTNAIKNPAETASNGILHVTKLTDTKVEQEWLSETNRAIRILENTSGANEFYVNDVLTAPKNGVISLDADKVYTLRGSLVGRVEIGSADVTAAGITKVILNGVTIRSEGTSAITYIPESKKLYVELRSDSKNYFIVEDKVSVGTSDIAALQSNNNMTITGTGYLAIKNTMGHAIKASELLIQGIPHIYCDAKHDAIHGGSMLKISGGVFYINHANDAVSSSEGADNLGAMFISGGKFIINECTESAFQGKSAKGLKKIYGNTEIELNGPFGAEVFKGETDSEIKIYENVKITATDGIVIPTLTEIKSEYGEPGVTFVPYEGEATEVKADDNIYVLTQTNTAGIYSIRGNFTGYKIYTATSKVDIEAFGIYYENDDATDTDAFITYNVNGKRLKIKFNENTISYINKKAGSCLTSAKNLQIVGKGDVFISNETGYGIYAPGGDTILAGDGTRYITNSNYGVLTSLLVLGEDTGDVADYEDGKKDPSTSEDAIYIIDNKEYDVYAVTRTNSSNIHQPGAVLATTYHAGSSILGKVIYKLETPNVNGETEELVGDITAETGITLATNTPKTSYEYSSTIYVKQNEDLTTTNVYTYSLPEDYNNNFPTLSNDTASTWTVYATPDNIYTEEEVNELFVPKATYEALNETVSNVYNALDNVLPAHAVTFALVTPENYEYELPTLTLYRNKDAAIADNVLGTLNFTTENPNPTSFTYNKDTGLKDNSVEDGQVNFMVSDLPAGYKFVVTIAPSGSYKNIKLTEIIEKPNFVNITKVSKDIIITITISEEA